MANAAAIPPTATSNAARLSNEEAVERLNAGSAGVESCPDTMLAAKSGLPMRSGWAGAARGRMIFRGALRLTTGAGVLRTTTGFACARLELGLDTRFGPEALPCWLELSESLMLANA